ncbi:MAG: undecaprenyl diphosphate synthase family protein, partial [Lachnospiraceae bacterium]|nr:undecaprenyl diphosphate synthase family protein [Lachnospiraceae bacterium]
MARKTKEEAATLKIPEHVAIIMDGNGRWAKKRLLPRSAGHSAGSRTVEQICDDAWS